MPCILVSSKIFYKHIVNAFCDVCPLRHSVAAHLLFSHILMREHIVVRHIIFIDIN